MNLMVCTVDKVTLPLVVYRRVQVWALKAVGFDR